MEDETKPPFPEKLKDGSSTSTTTTTESVITGKARPTESHVASISVRALIALIVILTVCYMSIVGTTVVEPLYTLAGLIVGFFFGQQTKPKNQQ